MATARKSASPPSDTDSVQSGAGLPWHSSLETKLGLIFLLLLALLIAGAYAANRALVRDGLLDESQRYEREVANHAAQRLAEPAEQVRLVASELAQLAAERGLAPAAFRLTAPRLAGNAAYERSIYSFGVWPEPRAGGGTAALWLRDGKGGFIVHDEVGRTAYPREPWYTPGRYVAAGSCWWTGLRQEPVTREPVVTCVTPIPATAGGFAGVVTVSIALEMLQERVNGNGTGRSDYTLLLDRDARVLAASGSAAGVLGGGASGQSLSELAKSRSSLMPLAAELRQQRETQDAAVVKSSRYQASSVSALRDATQGLSREQAEAILVGIWGVARQNGAALGDGRRVELADDPVLREPAVATVFASPVGAWQIAQVAPANTSFEGVSYIFMQALIATLVLVTITLLLVYFALRVLVVRPLRSFARQLEGSTSVEEALNVTLDESARNEVGVLAHWQNERTRQLAEALSSARAARTALSTESGERRQLQDQLARSQERATLALQSVMDAVIVTDEQGLVEDVNPAAEQLTGVSARQARGRALEDVLKVTLVQENLPAPNFARVVAEKNSRLDYPDELRLTSVNGVQHYIALSASPMRTRNRLAGVVVVFRERNAQAGTTINLGSDGGGQQFRDLTTGLPTRAACERRIEAVLEQARGTGGTVGALIFLDVDHLKRINNLGGQAAGDDVLVRVAETLAGAAPESGDVFRLAADQFAVVVGDSLERTGMAVAEELRGQLAGTRFYWESRYFSVTASFGVCPISKDEPSPLEVIRRADDACAAAKRAGRNNVQLYDPRMDRVERVVDDDAWVRCIRRGVDENLFHLRTQWIMPSSEHAADGHMFEVLLALEDEEGFWASPAAFMPVAERHHLCAEIDRWVIATTLAYLDSHPQIVKTLAVCSINLSSQTVTDPSFLEFMVGQLENRLPLASKLCFEVRELSLTEHPQEALPCCDALHKMGCKVAVDHYLGRYMSDLTLMRRLPVDFVKVDAMGYKHLSSDPVEQMLAESTLRIARHLRRRVVVTGIEEARSQETWRKLGANYFQGFAFAKPSPVIFLPPD